MWTSFKKFCDWMFDEMMVNWLLLLETAAVVTPANINIISTLSVGHSWQI